MYESLGMAAKAAGVSKSTILRAIGAHRISANKTDVGDWQIDPAELHRVFPPARKDRSAEPDAVRGATGLERHETALLEAQISGLRETAELLRRQVDDLRTDRDAWRDQAQAGQRLLAPPERLPKPMPEDAQPVHWAVRAWRWSRG